MITMLTMLDLFSGIGGFSLAASWTGAIETIAFCEIEPYCQKVLRKNFPGIPIHPDIKQLRREGVGTVDIVCGGPPCQPASCAGKRRGVEDDRWLWPETIRIVQEVHPRWCVFENPTGILTLNGGMEFEHILSELETEGYEVQAIIVPAASVGAPHLRYRVWIVANSNRHTGRSRGAEPERQQRQARFADGSHVMAYSNGGRSLQRKSAEHSAKERIEAFPRSSVCGQDIPNAGSNGRREPDAGEALLNEKRNNQAYQQDGRTELYEIVSNSKNVPDTSSSRLQIAEQEWKHGRPTTQCGWRTTEPRLGGMVDGLPAGLDGYWRVEPDIPRIATGIPSRVARIKALGNAIVPQVVYPIFQGIVEIETRAQARR